MDDTERTRGTDEDSRRDEQPSGAEDADETPAVEDEVDEASDQSFPASDPPAY